MKFFIGNVEIKNQIILAPMAGITSTTFRRICKNMGAGLVVAEMVSDKALIYESKKTYELLKMDESERPISQQIFGGEAETMASAAKIIEEYMHPDIIDINMGCPVPKVAVKNNAGSNLLKTPDRVREIVKAVVSAVSVPVTVKIRIGWDELSINATEIAKICEEAGASAIFVHGRTRKQGYSGEANWNVIKDVVNAVSIPVIGNGDVKSCYDAEKMLKDTGCAAVMIGRAALGNPWLIKECVEYLEAGTKPQEVTLKEKLDMMRYNIEELVNDKNEVVGVLEMRTQLMYYLKGMPNTKNLKLAICKANSKAELMKILDEYEKEVME
ncbi:MAG: tRNA dihydrouridine synthase DusB [Firmicutes bacterium]|nr:tRNA dihydrouridine synthase DusB [Bacillota bacterium]